MSNTNNNFDEQLFLTVFIPILTAWLGWFIACCYFAQRSKVSNRKIETAFEDIEPAGADCMLQEHNCVLDKVKNVSSDNWAITLIRQKLHSGVSCYDNKHVKILYEGFDNGKYFVKIVHLVARSSVPSANGLIRSKDYIDEKDVTEKVLAGKAIEYAGKTPTYVVPRHDAELMLRRIESTKNDRTFDLLGRHSVFNAPARYCGIMKDNCFTWAMDKIYHAGIKLPSYTNLGVSSLYSDSIDDIHENVVTVPYDVADLCKLAKLGANETIMRRFPIGSINVNQLVDFSHPEGPVEVFLGHYTPLALAIAYNHFDTVKLLCESYHADLHLLSGRGRDFTALDCANKNWWGANYRRGFFNFFSGRPDGKIKHYLIQKGAMAYGDLRGQVLKNKTTPPERVFKVALQSN